MKYHTQKCTFTFEKTLIPVWACSVPLVPEKKNKNNLGMQKIKINVEELRTSAHPLPN